MASKISSKANLICFYDVECKIYICQSQKMFSGLWTHFVPPMRESRFHENKSIQFSTGFLTNSLLWIINVIMFFLTKACFQLNELFLINIAIHQTLAMLYACEVICHIPVRCCPFATHETTETKKDN